MNVFFFFFNDTATTEIYTLSLHDALPISRRSWVSGEALVGERCERGLIGEGREGGSVGERCETGSGLERIARRSEEHTSELQSQSNLVCRLLLEKKKKIVYYLQSIA